LLKNVHQQRKCKAIKEMCSLNKVQQGGGEEEGTFTGVQIMKFACAFKIVSRNFTLN
jgi:hypothetical protein